MTDNLESRAEAERIIRRFTQLRKQLHYAFSKIEQVYNAVLETTLPDETKAKALAKMLVNNTRLGRLGVFSFQEALDYAMNDIEDNKKMKGLLEKLKNYR